MSSSSVSSWKWTSALVISTIAVVGTGALVYSLYTSSAKPAPEPLQKNEGTPSSKKKKNKKKTKNSSANVSPVPPKTELSASPLPDGVSSPDSSVEKTMSKSDSGVLLESVPKPENVLKLVVDDSLTKEQRQEYAQEAKTIGNKLYGQKKFEEAIEYYNKAIELVPLAVYFSNRAACHAYLQEYEKVVQDCNKALALEPKYLKALNRRATAHQNLKNLPEALNDYTAVCVLEGFKTESSMSAADRVLKEIAAQRTKQIMETKIPSVPSNSFIVAYLESFRSRPSDADTVKALETSNESDVLLKEAYEALDEKKWDDAIEKMKQAIEKNDFSAEVIAAKAFNLKSTFGFLMGEVDAAVSDLETSLELDPKNVNSIIKRATLFMERGQVEKAAEQFQYAETVEPTNPDLYYHRGQIKFLTGDYQGASDDYTLSLKHEKPEESCVYVHIQLGVSKYKLGDLGGAERKFKEAKRLFPDSAEAFNYHGEIQMDREQFTDALKSFDKAIEMDSTNPLPYINKAILHMQWKKDVPAAIEECRKAIAVDAKCDIAYSQLAQFLCHENQIEEAIGIYDKAVPLARSEAEVLNLISCQEAAKAQQYVVSTYPEAMSMLARQQH